MKGEFWLSPFFFAPVVTCHGVAYNHLFIVSGIEVEGNVFLEFFIVAKIDVKPRAKLEMHMAVIGTATIGASVQTDPKYCSSYS